MSRRFRLFAELLTALISISVFAHAVCAQTAFISNRVVSIDEDPAGQSITLNTSTDTPLPAPLIQYLPGPDGRTLMVADFQGLFLKVPTHVVRPQPTGGEPGANQSIESIRIGQFQETPAICRVSVSAKHARAFKTITFKAVSGALIIKWADQPVAVTPTRDTTPEPAVVERPLTRSHPPRRAPDFVPSVPATPLVATAGKLPPVAPDFVSPAKPTRVGKQAQPSPERAALPVPAPTVGMTMHKTLREERPKKGKDAGRETALVEESSEGTKKHGLLSKLLGKGNEQDEKITRDDPSSDRKLTVEPPVAPPIAAAPATIKTAAASGTTPSEKAAMSEDKDPSLSSDEMLPPTSNTLSESADISITKGETVLGQEADLLKVDVTGPRKLSYKSFRLHDPERLVFDFTNFPELMNADLPKESSSLLNGIRLGSLADKPGIARLVLDLPDAGVNVNQQFADENTTLSLSLSRHQNWSIPPIGQLRVPGSMLFVLDAGHGGTDPGAQRGNIQEKEITLGIVNRLKKALEKRGATIVMTRSDDTFVSLEDRVKVTNNTVPDLFLSVHINALESTSDIHGIETYYQTEQSRLLADSIHQSLVSGLSAPDRNVRKARFYVINHTQVPAVLAEVGFISNKEEREKLISSDYQDKVAESLAQGVMLYLAKKPEGGPSVANTSKAQITSAESQRGPKSRAASLAQSGLIPASTTK